MDSGDRPTDIPRPFGDAPRRSPVEESWRRPVFVGCGLLALLAVIAVTLMLLNAGEIFRWGLGMVRSDVMANLPAEVTEEERERLAAAFDAAGEAVAAGEVEPAALQRFQQRLMAVAQTPAGERTREQLLELTEALEEVAASGRGDDGMPQEPVAAEPGTEPTAAPTLLEQEHDKVVAEGQGSRKRYSLTEEGVRHCRRLVVRFSV